MKSMLRLGCMLALGSVFFFNSSCQGKRAANEDSTSESRKKTYEWKMATTWPPNFPILDESAKKVAQLVEQMSGGQLKIKVYGAGELVPAFEVFENVSTGTIHMGHSAPYYWGGKIPASIPFTTIPFGVTGLHHAAWIYHGDGGKMWEDVYAEHNVVPFLVGSSGTQMGGWFNKELKSVKDLDGLKMRIPGWGGKVLEKVGGSAVTLPGGEIYTSLERGVVDAAEWIGPGNDYSMGFNKIAKYYYYPGWHEPGTSFEVIVNKKAYDKLPKHLQAIIEAATGYAALWTMTKFDFDNATNLKKMREEGLTLKKFPPDIIKAFRDASQAMINEEIAKDANLKRAYESLIDFKNLIGPWYNVSEGAVAPKLYGQK